MHEDRGCGVRLFTLFLSPRGEIGRVAFCFVALAATAATLAGIIYVEEHLTGRERDRDIVHLLIAATCLWILAAAVIKRVRHLGLTIGDLLLILLGAVWVAGTVGLLTEISEAMRVLRDWNYAPNPTNVIEVVRWGLIGWAGLFLFMLAFVSGENAYGAYKPVIRTYARKKRSTIILLALSVMALLILFRYLGTK